MQLHTNISVCVPLGSGGPLFEATFVARPNRFLVEALLDGSTVVAHLADRGRLTETLIPGVTLLLSQHDRPERKTKFQAVAAYRGDTLASLDTHLPNRLIKAALEAQAFSQFSRYPNIRREVKIGASRFDFQVSDGERICIIEVKSAGLIIDDRALFPDAPTERGRRHVQELAALAHEGLRTAVIFVAQGGAAQAVVMNTDIDPTFAATLQKAVAAGVEVYGYACHLTNAGLALGHAIPINFS
ncbi:MAG: DNA/RNA nuclease SfsA [Chloroflexi bacterium AL-W]|nr:DNA/RNA nuclease SfsA [Chloroflexi bacterium AL-N1]NOK64654.1 DNA/RNA nuclease SfsA [Chloroflexi bacterium AL-N10]NOK75895.1 DNA/RNA nuclease SfsA [Chloroflexi bacterium AL-N5]NOK80346.1 DNA/RNA nuclease SfsA [Chloroflexi bacterium AL-W]NOK86859.1 DNA/RNA nuclease SfsA [Chloroflexi bacterium AL-N15]